MAETLQLACYSWSLELPKLPKSCSFARAWLRFSTLRTTHSGGQELATWWKARSTGSSLRIFAALVDL